MYYISLILWGHLISGVLGLIIDYFYFDIFDKEVEEFIETLNRENKYDFIVTKKMIIVIIILLGYVSLYSTLKSMIKVNKKS